MAHATSSRTPQWKSADKDTTVKCANCGYQTIIGALNPEMRCPACDKEQWVMAQPNSGERNQIPAKPAPTSEK
jgi:hypothetical protein